MEINQIKRTVQDFVKGIEALVEKSLGDRSQLEDQVRQFTRNVEKTVSEMVWNRKTELEQVTIKVQKLIHYKGDLPKYETDHASGFDVRAQISESVALSPGQRSLIPTGLSFEIPPGFEIQVRARSGWAVRNGIGLVNAPGTVDADYRGEVKVILINWGTDPVTINDQDRIAQLVVCPVVHAQLVDGEDLSKTKRGEGGFGSTGHS